MRPELEPGYSWGGGTEQQRRGARETFPRCFCQAPLLASPASKAVQPFTHTPPAAQAGIAVLPASLPRHRYSSWSFSGKLVWGEVWGGFKRLVVVQMLSRVQLSASFPLEHLQQACVTRQCTPGVRVCAVCYPCRCGPEIHSMHCLLLFSC